MNARFTRASHLRAIYAILLIAFAARIFMLPAVRHDYDHGYPHGLGIVILESLAAGRLSELPLTSLIAAIDLPNPAGASYLWALVSLLDRSAYFATAISAMLNVLAVAMIFDLARQVFGRSAGFIAALLAACSPWAIWVATGTWIQGLLEFASITVAWLAIIAIKRSDGRRLLAGFIAVAFFMQTYLVAFGLLTQVMLACVLGFNRRLIKPMAAGLGICLLGLAVYGVAVVSTGRNPLNNLQRWQGPPAGAAAPVDRDPTTFNLDGLRHAFRIPSGRDFENAALFGDVEQRAPGFAARDGISDLRATIIDVLIWIGLALAVYRARRSVGARLLVGWFVFPIVLTLGLSTVMRSWLIHPFYLLLSSPAGYALAGAPFMIFDARRNVSKLAPVGLAAIAIVLAAVPIVNLILRADDVAHRPWVGSLQWLPLRWQMQLGQIWRDHCDAVNITDTRRGEQFWYASVAQSAALIRNEGWRTREHGDIWSTSPDGGNCVTTVDAPTPANAEVLSLRLNDGATVTTYRTLPYTNSNLQTQTALNVNLNWTLLDLQTPNVARPGQMITVTHAWRIDALPDEPHEAWFYAPFVKLIAPDGRVLASVDDAPALLGWSWRPGEIIMSQVRLQIPEQLPTGEYELETSLFDPNQKKNAVYFDPKRPIIPIVTIRRNLAIQ